MFARDKHTSLSLHSPADKILPATAITSSSEKKVGKFICHYGTLGLALLRVQDV